MRIELVDALGRELARTSASGFLDLDCTRLPAEEKQRFLEEVAVFQAGRSHVQAGEHRLADWANGWAENLEGFRQTRDPARLIPRYFGKYPEIRLNGEILIDRGASGELTLLRALQTAAVAYAKSLTGYTSLCEFGAGTGHNLLNFAADASLRSLRGFEWSWSGVDCIREAGSHLDARVSGQFFDYYAPALTGETDLSDSCVVTVASLEQIGDKFRPFLEFLRRTRPRVVVNIEPIRELMGTGPLAELSKAYARNRNYLEGFYDYLQNLRKAGVIEILLEQESSIGSKFINGYGTIIWRWAN